MAKVNVYEMDDSEWWIGHSAEECAAGFTAEYGDTHAEPRKLEKWELESLDFLYCEKEITFYERYLEQRRFGPFPRCFAVQDQG